MESSSVSFEISSWFLFSGLVLILLLSMFHISSGSFAVEILKKIRNKKNI